MKRFIFTVLLLFSLTFSSPTYSQTIDQVEQATEIVEDVGSWRIENFTVFGVWSIILLASIVLNIKMSWNIQSLNNKMLAMSEKCKVETIENLEQTLEKYVDLAVLQRSDAEKIKEILIDIKQKVNEK